MTHVNAYRYTYYTVFNLFYLIYSVNDFLIKIQFILCSIYILCAFNLYININNVLMCSKEISRFHDLDFFIIPTMKYLWNIKSVIGKKKRSH